MSIDLPANIESALERYALAEQTTPVDAAVKFIQDGIESYRRKRPSERLSEADWKQFRESVPGIELFESLPEGTIEAIAKNSRRLRTQKLAPRA